MYLASHIRCCGLYERKFTIHVTMVQIADIEQLRYGSVVLLVPGAPNEHEYPFLYTIYYSIRILTFVYRIRSTWCLG